MAPRSSQKGNIIVARHFAALLPWLGFLLAVYAVYELENAVTSSSPTFGTWPSGTGESPALRLVAPSASLQRIPITIILHDASTGRDLEWQCMTPRDSVSTEDLVVDANAWADVAAALCSS
jgi:hypothetical protein